MLLRKTMMKEMKRGWSQKGLDLEASRMLNVTVDESPREEEGSEDEEKEKKD